MQWEKIMKAYNLDVINTIDDDTFIVDTGITYLVHFRKGGQGESPNCYYVDEYIIDDIPMDWTKNTQNLYNTVKDILTNGVPLRSVTLCEWLEE